MFKAYNTMQFNDDREMNKPSSKAWRSHLIHLNMILLKIWIYRYHMHPISTSSTTLLSFSMSLWDCQSAVNKADLISAFSLQSTLGLDWDLDSSRRLRNPSCPLQQFIFISHPTSSWLGWGHWSAHFKQLEILNPLSPMQLQLIWISCDYSNSSYKTPDCGNLPSPWPNSSHFPRGAWWATVLFHGGWHSNS